MQWQPQTLESSQVSAGGSLIDVGEATTPGSEARSTRARSASILDQFEDIRPYRDEELADKLAELSEDLTLIRTVCTFTIPRLYRMFPAECNGCGVGFSVIAIEIFTTLKISKT